MGTGQVNGDHHYDSRKGLLLWTIDLIDKTNSSGAMEFVASPAAPSDSFFPVEVRRGARNAASTMSPTALQASVCVFDECVRGRLGILPAAAREAHSVCRRAML